jgi:hypothetical protein
MLSHEVTMSCKYVGRETDDQKWEHYRWRLRLAFQGRHVLSTWRAGTGHTNANGSAKEPALLDVLSCLQSDSHAGENTFRSFCDDFGYEHDSRKAESIWRACRKMRGRLSTLFGDRFAEFLQTDFESLSSESPDFVLNESPNA